MMKFRGVAVLVTITVVLVALVSLPAHPSQEGKAQGTGSARWVNIPHPVAAVNVVEWEVVDLPREGTQQVQLLAVECWMEPPYLQGMNAGQTKCGVLMRGDGFPSDQDFHQSNDPDIMVVLSVAGFKTNPASPDGQGIGLFQEWIRWEPPTMLYAPERIAVAFQTTNPGAILHARVWYRVQ